MSLNSATARPVYIFALHTSNRGKIIEKENRPVKPDQKYFENRPDSISAESIDSF